MADMRKQCGVCGSPAFHSTWHGWKVDWEQVKPKLSKKCRDMLKHDYVCNDCKAELKAELVKE